MSALQNQTSRQLSVMSQIGRIIDRHNATQESVGLAAIDTIAGSNDPQRLAQIEGLVNTLRASLCSDGEVSQPMVLATGVQLVAWLVALEERDETRQDAA